MSVRKAATALGVSKTPARHDKITPKLREPGLGDLSDLGFTGLDDGPDNPVIVTGFKAARNKHLTRAKEEANKLIAAERAACEHVFAHLKNWRILTKLRQSAQLMFLTFVNDESPLCDR